MDMGGDLGEVEDPWGDLFLKGFWVFRIYSLGLRFMVCR